MENQGRSKWERTGGWRKPFRNKKRYRLGYEPAATTVSELWFQTIDSRGNNEKLHVLSMNVVQVVDGADATQADIESTVDDSSNANYVCRNIVTKGFIIDASADRACVTSRPGQDGQINAVVVNDE